MITHRTPIHYNKPQLRSMIVGAPNETAIFGRGTGKTEGVGAPKTATRYLNPMPRGSGVIVSRTFVQALTRTLPGLIYGWEKIGYKENVHFIIGKRPPDKWVKFWNWKGPFRKPLRYDYFISWFNGGGIHLVSQDVTGSSNGITIDWIYGDEAKFLDREKFSRELVPANRGLIKDFESCPYHHGITLTSDMPMDSSGRWLLDREKDNDDIRIKKILDLQYAKALINASNDYAAAKKNKLCKGINELIMRERMGDGDKISKLNYYHEASTLDNIDVLGSDYILEQLQNSSLFEFDTQILNRRPVKSQNNFYPDLSEEKHGYFDFNYGHIHLLNRDALGNKDCRWDNDYDKTKALHIALDYNKRIHPMVIGQLHGNELRFINCLYSSYPGKLREVLDMFIQYYRFRNNELVYYWYDHTAVAELRANTMADEVISYLNDNGFTVVPCYIGKSDYHAKRYQMWGHLLKEDGHYDKIVRMNRENCKFLFLSMQQAESELKRNGFKKIKQTEKDPEFPAEESTHFSEAADTLADGILESGLLSDHENTTLGWLTNN